MSKQDQCGVQQIHPERVERVERSLASDDELVELAAIFKLLSDPNRLKILYSLLLAELCVCDIAAILTMSQPCVSYHLRSLREQGLIDHRREGKLVFYTIKDDRLRELLSELCL